MRSKWAMVAVAVWYGSAGLAQGPAFDVAAIKPSAKDETRWSLRNQGGGRFSVIGLTLEDLVRVTYGDSLGSDLEVRGGEDWVRKQKFDIQAQAPAGESELTFTQFRPMFAALLAERFGVKVRKDTREVSVLGLRKARADGKLGPNVSEWDGTCNGQPAPPLQERNGPRCSAGMPPRVAIHGGSMATLAMILSMPDAGLDRPVMDETGIEGYFDMSLEYEFTRRGADGRPTNPLESEGPSLATALQEQLGLKLEASRGKIDVLVIDAAHQPTEN